MSQIASEHMTSWTSRAAQREGRDVRDRLCGLPGMAWPSGGGLTGWVQREGAARATSGHNVGTELFNTEKKGEKHWGRKRKLTIRAISGERENEDVCLCTQGNKARLHNWALSKDWIRPRKKMWEEQRGELLIRQQDQRDSWVTRGQS